MHLGRPLFQVKPHAGTGLAAGPFVVLYGLNDNWPHEYLDFPFFNEIKLW